MAKHKSRHSAEKTLRNFFSGNTDVDSLLIEDIFKNMGRDGRTREKNVSWLSNVLATLKYYGLATPIYTHDGRKKLDKIKLTDDGKKALEKASQSTDNQLTPVVVSVESRVTFDQIIQLVEAYKHQNPQYDVGFALDVKLKNQ